VLKNFTAVVTGGGKGIGKAAALALARQGAYVIVNALHSESAQNAVDEIKNGGGQAYAWPHDVTKEDTISSLTETIKETTGKLHILVNSAGGGIASARKKFLDLSVSDWNTQLSLNLSSTFYCCKAAIPLMLENNYGRIINISSSAGLRGGTANATVGYSASKAGVIGLTRALSQEVADKGICVVAVAPHYFETPLMEFLSEAQKQAIRSKIPVKTGGDPADLAEIIAFLASRHTKYMTGVVIPVDGGTLHH
jgi:3-oxoacyl-[acyl-carrier protein] reductase